VIPISKPHVGNEEREAVLAVLDSGMLAQGERTAELERRFAQLCGTQYAIAVSSGTAALHLALLAHDIGPGDEVITSPFTFIASPNSILFTGARPVFVDTEPDTFNIDVTQIRQAITPRTKAIMPVHLYGQMCEMEELAAIAEHHHLVIIEDAAQAVGATYQGKAAGSFGTGAFSLYATKNIMTGEGGMITTSDQEVAERCRLLRNHGMKQRYHYEMLGYNYRISDVHAAIGLAQLDRLGEFTVRRQANATFFDQRLTAVITPKVRPGNEHVWHQYTVRLEGGQRRDAAIKQLADAGIGTGVFYPIPAHKHAYMRDLLGDLTFPVAEQLAREVLSIPVHPQLGCEDLETIVAAVNSL
jgi:dTDP-4-amino-4,6-dideoxygalactose transaminase